MSLTINQDLQYKNNKVSTKTIRVYKLFSLYKYMKNYMLVVAGIIETSSRISKRCHDKPIGYLLKDRKNVSTHACIFTHKSIRQNIGSKYHVKSLFFLWVLWGWGWLVQWNARSLKPSPAIWLEVLVTLMIEKVNALHFPWNAAFLSTILNTYFWTHSYAPRLHIFRIISSH